MDAPSNGQTARIFKTCSPKDCGGSKNGEVLMSTVELHSLPSTL